MKFGASGQSRWKWNSINEATPFDTMKKSEIIDKSHKFAEPYCVTNGKKFRLKDVDPADTGEATSEDKPLSKELLETGIQALAELQDQRRTGSSLLRICARNSLRRRKY